MTPPTGIIARISGFWWRMAGIAFAVLVFAMGPAMAAAPRLAVERIVIETRGGSRWRPTTPRGNWG